MPLSLLVVSRQCQRLACGWLKTSPFIDALQELAQLVAREKNFKVFNKHETKFR